MTTSEISSAPRRRLRYVLISLAAFAATLALFYAEEDWRGWRVMENYKRESEAKGAPLNWADCIPAPVPDNENIFAVPEMQRWFVRQGVQQTNELTQKMHYPAWDNPARIVVAQLTIGLPGATPAAGSTVLQWGDPKAKQTTGWLIKEAVRLVPTEIGPVVVDPGGPYYTLGQPKEIHPAQIFLQCQTQPSENDVRLFALPSFASDSDPRMGMEHTGNSYNVMMSAPGTVAEFLKWNEQLEPEFTLIRKALQRPYARINGDYSIPSEISIPSWASVRALAQRLSALSRCHMMLGQPEKALDELTFMHQLCRVLEGRPTGKPMTLVAAMINVAVAGLYAGDIAEGMRLKAWQEPQLAALQQQLKEINLHPFVTDAFAMEREAIWHDAEVVDLAKLVDWQNPPKFSWYNLWPRGWVYQNMVFCAQRQQKTTESFSPADGGIVPHKIEAALEETDKMVAHWTPFKVIASMAIPNARRAGQTLLRNQTMVNQAQIACALERYDLAHGEYPGTLEQLTPRFIEIIPADLVGGQPPHYRRNGDGTFLLYSIGWSEKDLGGKANPTPNSPTPEQYDLVWPEK
jgi:hypothetical protein